MAVPGQLQSQSARRSQPGGPLKEWEFPDAESHRNGAVGNVHAGDYATSKSFEEVWTYYAKKMGYKGKYIPNEQFSGGTADGGSAEIMFMNSTDMTSTASRPKVTSSTLIRRGSGASVTVFLSRGKDEDKTYITLIVERK
jgi:hypothetical protein